MKDLNYLMFHGFLGRQCKFTKTSYDKIRRILKMRANKQISDDNREIVVNQFWYAVDALLTSTANISKTLWGTESHIEGRDTRSQIRGEELRTILDITGMSNLRSRKVRDYFEHFDERIDEWCQTEHKCVFDSNIVEYRKFRKVNSKDRLRIFDPETQNLYVGSLRIGFKSLTAEVDLVKKKLDAHLPKKSEKEECPETIV